MQKQNTYSDNAVLSLEITTGKGVGDGRTKVVGDERRVGSVTKSEKRSRIEQSVSFSQGKPHQKADNGFDRSNAQVGPGTAQRPQAEARRLVGKTCLHCPIYSSKGVKKPTQLVLVLKYLKSNRLVVKPIGAEKSKKFTATPHSLKPI